MKLSGIWLVPKGMSIYRRLKRIDRNSLKIVCPAGIGDTINVMRLTEEYRKINQIEELILVLKETQQEIPDWYKIRAKKIVLSSSEMRGLYLYMTIFRKYDRNHILYAFFHRNLIGKIIQPGKIVTDYAELIMHVPAENAASPDIPFVEYQDFKNAVLLAPYSYSLQGIPFSFYQKLANELTEKGYTVYCNLQSSEKPLEHTIPLYLTLTDLVKSAPSFRLIVSSRSGLCDALALCKCRIVILYLERYMKIEGKCLVDDVSDLNGCSTVTNLQYRPDRESALIWTCTELAEAK